MAITLVASRVDTPGANGGATSAINTTGANLLVLSVSWYAAGTTTLNVSDSKGNTWIPLTLRNTATTAHRFYYAKNATVGTGHTVTVSATGIYPVLAFHAFSGVDPTAPFDVENGITATAGSSLATGSATPAVAGSLVVSGWAGMNGTNTPNVDSGLALTAKQAPSGGTNVAGAAGWIVQSTSASAVNPLWSWTGTDHVAEAVAVFKPASAPVAGSFSLVAAVVAGSSPGIVTTAAINTTGADLLVLGVAYNVGGPPSVSDSKGNTWIALTARTSSNASHRFFYAKNPTVGSGHTFTVSGSFSYPGIVVQAFSGADTTAPFDVEAGTSGSSGTSAATGAITPSAANCLIVAGCANESVTGLRVDAGLLQTTLNQLASAYLGSATGWKAQTTAAAISPTWQWTPSSTWAASVVAFKPAAPSSTVARTTQLVAETLSHPTPDARLSHLVAETLTSLAAAVPPDARLTQLVVETLTESPPPIDTLVTQLVVETLSEFIVDAVVTQVVVETLTDYTPSPLRVSQSPLEILDQYPTTARVSQAPVETAIQWTAPQVGGRLSQAPVEIIYPFGCYIPQPPPCPQEFPIEEDGGGSCPAPILP
jgi:hypothetical protein